MSFLLKLLGTWVLVSAALAALLGRVLRLADRRAEALRDRSALPAPKGDRAA